MICTPVAFKLAKPVYAAGLSGEMNTAVLFCAEISAGEGTCLRLAGHCSYEVFINGEFVHYGPARAGRHHYRVDELAIDSWLTEEKNSVSIILSSYRCASFAYFNEPGFLAAEFERCGKVFCATGSDAWALYRYTEREQKVERYSFQRTFVECHDLRQHPDRLSGEGRIPCAEKNVAAGKFIAREVGLPELPVEEYETNVGCGRVETCEPEKFSSVKIISKAGRQKEVQGFVREEARIPLHEVQRMNFIPEEEEISCLPYRVEKNGYLLTKLKGERTGLIRLCVECKADAELYVTFDEILRDGKIDILRMGCGNVVTWKLPAGRHTLITAEPYSLQYMNIIARENPVTVLSAGVIRTDFNASEITLSLNREKADDEIARIFDAAVETFRQNTFDIYMDCPSRERAGWLCDSFFTSRVEKLLTGKSRVEHAFLANFAMEDTYTDIPAGMLPMCYPSDHLDGVFIPNWAMWFFLELKEYLDRTGDREFVDSMRDKAYGLLSYFRAFENEDGLLEKLKGWVFLEWSKSNDLVQDINYPSNMLYYRFKKVLCELYGDSALSEEADRLRTKIRSASRGELFYCDNAVYGEDGTLRLSGICTESCQYYAFFTGVATLAEDAELWNTLLKDFGPERKESGKWSDIPFANAFIGNYLRCELLMREGELSALEENIRGYFDYMARRTGTLWENDSDHASCNHGFASHVLIWLDRLGYTKRD
ncbi:MAG: hypothetical protein IKL89_08710 [Clostridia bacterium]|nr:hypothetical protein [Clostridia bacterium]